jgi:hypothetical protein
MARGVLLCGLLLGLSACNSKAKDEFKPQDGQGTKVEPAHTHHHHDEPGPHKGMLADLTGGKMVELVYSAEPRSITIYVLNHNDPTKAEPIEAKSMTLELEGASSPLTLSAEPQEADGEGKASKFVVEGAAIPDTIKDQENIHGHLQVEIGGETLEAEFEHHEEDEHKD